MSAAETTLSRYVGVRVKLVPDKGDVYYGVLETADATFVTLSDYITGWHGQAGWWAHGEGKTVAIPVTRIRSIVPSDWKPPR